MAKKTSPEQGDLKAPGELEPGALFSATRGRALFLDAVRRRVPAVLTGPEGLDGAPLRAARAHPAAPESLQGRYQSVLITGIGPLTYIDWKSGEEKLASYLKGDVALPPDEQAIADAVLSWGRRWNLSDPWCFDAAVTTLVSWLRDGPDASFAGLLLWAYRKAATPGFRWDADSSAWSQTESDAVELNLRLDRWEPALETRASYIRRAESALHAAVSSYCDLISAREQAHGFAPSATKYGSHHFDWLAVYQCAMASYPEIRDSKDIWGADYVSSGRGPSLSTIKKGIKSTGALIMITLREADEGGRPPIHPT